MKDPAILLYKDKWITATQGMSGAAKGWYLDLILYQYDKTDLPNDIDELASIARIRPSEFNLFEQVFEQVLKQKFKQNENGRLQNEFALEIMTGRELFKDKRSDAGKLSYILRYWRAHKKEFKKVDNGFEAWLKENIDLTIQTNNEQVLKQVFEQKVELYINVNENVNKDIVIDENSMLNKFNSWLKINASQLLKMDEPFNESQLLSIKEKYPDSKFREKILISMGNWKQLLKKNKSAYLTFITWAEREIESDTKSTIPSKEVAPVFK